MVGDSKGWTLGKEFAGTRFVSRTSFKLNADGDDRLVPQR